MIDHLYSDPHFGHANVIKYSRRPFYTVDEMNSELIRRYNVVVKPSDVTVWLGDCFFTNEGTAMTILASLNGRKILVMGNHDRSKSWMARIGFDLVVEREMYLHIAGRHCRLTHYPYAGTASAEERDEGTRERFQDRRPPRVKGEVLIHGHTHSDKRLHENMVHVGVDAWSYAPASIAEVAELVGRI
jgi:calcineurin-like phosphoesterase family protein